MIIICTEQSILSPYGKHLTKIYDQNGEVDLLATCEISSGLLNQEKEREEMEVMKLQHEQAVEILSKEIIEGVD